MNTKTELAKLRTTLQQAIDEVAGTGLKIIDDYWGTLVAYHSDLGGINPKRTSNGWEVWSYNCGGEIDTSGEHLALSSALQAFISTVGYTAYTLTHNGEWKLYIDSSPVPLGEDGNPHPEKELFAKADRVTRTRYYNIPDYRQVQEGLDEERAAVFAVDQFTWPDDAERKPKWAQDGMRPLIAVANTPDGPKTFNVGSHCYKQVTVHEDGDVTAHNYNLDLQFVQNRWSENIEVEYFPGGFDIIRTWNYGIRVRPDGTVHITGTGPSFSRKNPNIIDVTREFKDMRIDPAELSGIPGGIIKR